MQTFPRPPDTPKGPKWLRRHIDLIRDFTQSIYPHEGGNMSIIDAPGNDGKILSADTGAPGSASAPFVYPFRVLNASDDTTVQVQVIPGIISPAFWAPITPTGMDTPPFYLPVTASGVVFLELDLSTGPPTAQVLFAASLPTSTTEVANLQLASITVEDDEITQINQGFIGNILHQLCNSSHFFSPAIIVPAEDAE